MVMASVRLSLRLMLMLICTEDTMDMVLDMDTLVLDTMVLDTEFMENVLLMPSQKLTPTFSMEDMDMDTLDMPEFAKIFMGRKNENAWLVGGIVPGGILGVWRRDVYKGARNALLFGLLGYAYQYSTNNNLTNSFMP